jgi:hypothetical protein
MEGLKAQIGRVLCWIRLHRYVFYNPLENTIACGRSGCQAKKKAIPDRELKDLRERLDKASKG